MAPTETSLVVHRNEPEPMTIDIETGVSASGKTFYTVKVRNATNVAEALRVAQEVLAHMPKAVEP